MTSGSLVSIDFSVLESLAADLEPALESHSIGRSGGRDEDPLSPADSPKPQRVAIATLVFALDAINFGSGYHDEVRKRPGLSGSRTMAASLRDHVDETGGLTADHLQMITKADCYRIFGQDVSNETTGELMGLFSTALSELGGFLERGGDALQLIADAERSAEQLAEKLLEMPYYRDVHQLDGKAVSFYKRAQITAADLVRELGEPLFDDLDELTAFADNLVPHVLRVDRALIYDRELGAAIDQGHLLRPGGRAEIEIRAAGIVCVENLSELTGTSAMDIDLALWERGAGAQYKGVPRHRCRSVFYRGTPPPARSGARVLWRGHLELDSVSCLDQSSEA